MSSTEITIVISDQLAREAAAKGLLTSQSVEELLRAELRRRVEEHFRDVSASLPYYKRVKVLHFSDEELPIDRVFPLGKIADALALMRANKHFGKIVIEM